MKELDLSIPEEETALDTQWITKDGRVMTLGQMDDNHLRNATRMVKRAIENQEKELSACFSCLAMFQGDMATYYAEQDADQIAQVIGQLNSKYQIMLEACALRNIQL